MRCLYGVLGLLSLADLPLAQAQDGPAQDPAHPERLTPGGPGISVGEWQKEIVKQVAQANKDLVKGMLDRQQDRWDKVKDKKASVEEQEPAPKYVPKPVDLDEEKDTVELGFFETISQSFQAFLTSLGMAIANFFKKIGESLTAMATGKQTLTDLWFPDDETTRHRVVEVSKEVNYPVPKEQSPAEQRRVSNGVSDLPSDEAITADKHGGRWSDMFESALGGVSQQLNKGLDDATRGVQDAQQEAQNAAVQGYETAQTQIIEPANAARDKMVAGAVTSQAVATGVATNTGKAWGDLATGKKDNWQPWSTSGKTPHKPLLGLGFLASPKVPLQQNPQKLADIRLRRES